ncbi:hypothetical protein U9M48_023126 [Paspalum notatum var. saurae]|uniref:Uncharacterized protein n=1 Tax=Paspalum notatum var. saurae TaxID=547442 RepID=A0AAQ3WUT4_PASNO
MKYLVYLCAVKGRMSFAFHMEINALLKQNCKVLVRLWVLNTVSWPNNPCTCIDVIISIFLKLWLYQDKKPSWMPDYILPKMTFFVAGPQRVELSSFDYFGNP